MKALLTQAFFNVSQDKITHSGSFSREERNVPTVATKTGQQRLPSLPLSIQRLCVPSFTGSACQSNYSCTTPQFTRLHYHYFRNWAFSLHQAIAPWWVSHLRVHLSHSSGQLTFRQQCPYRRLTLRWCGIILYLARLHSSFINTCRHKNN